MSARTPILAAALAATLVLGTAGGAVAGAMITGAQIKNGTLTSADIKRGSLKAEDLSPKAVAQLRGQAGPAGPAGPAGARGETGPSASDFADSTLPYGSPLNSFGGSSSATSVASQTISIATSSRLVVTGSASFWPEGSAEYAVECVVRLRPQGGADSTETSIGAPQSVLGLKSASGSSTSNNVTALGSAARPAGSYTVHLRCSDSLSQPAELKTASVAVVATADAG